MGALATLEGAFAVLGEDSMRGVRLALEEFNYTAGGKKIELITGSSDASPDSAVRATRKLVEQDGVQVLIGPLSRSEEHTSELQSLMRISYAVFCLKKKNRPRENLISIIRTSNN